MRAIFRIPSDSEVRLSGRIWVGDVRNKTKAALFMVKPTIDSMKKFTVKCKISDIMSADFREASCHGIPSVFPKFRILQSRTTFQITCLSF